jgi:Tol biopolymer transport system component
VLTDLTTGLDRVIAPPGGLGFIGGRAFSPDGKTLAAFTLVHSKLTNDTMQLALIDVGTGKVSPVSKSTGQFGEPYGFATWSPSGQSVFFGGVGQIRTSFQDLRIGAYQISASSATALPFPVNYSAVAVNH